MPYDPFAAVLPLASKPPRILVVEDDFLIRVTLAEVLIDEGYEVVEAESGDQALTLLNSDIALVVTDVQLPGALNGPMLIEKARETRPDLPAIYTSGRSVETMAPGGRDRAIGKPYEGATIAAAIQQMLAASS